MRGGFTRNREIPHEIHSSRFGAGDRGRRHHRFGGVYVAVPSFAAEMTVEVGGAPMYPSKNIVENAVNSKDHTTLVAAVKAAGLVETL